MYQSWIDQIQKQNEDWGGEQKITVDRGVPDSILMIDQKTTKLISPEMRSFYSLVSEWEGGFQGMTAVHPSDLPALYLDEFVASAISETGKYFKPLPPCDPTDWPRTALFGYDKHGIGVILYWWGDSKSVEPHIVSIDGGNAAIFYDLKEYIQHTATGHSSSIGDEIYSRLEEERGTLSD